MKIRFPFALAIVAGLATSVASAQIEVNQPEAVENPAAPMVELFEPAENVPVAAFIPVGYTSVHKIRLRTKLLNGLTPGQEFTVSPEPGVVVKCIVADVRRPSGWYTAVVGRCDTGALGDVMFSTFDDATAMVLSVPSQRLRYRLQFAGNGLYEVWRIDEATLEPEAMPLTAPPELPRMLDPDDDDYLPPEALEPEFGERVGGGCTGGTPILDQMVVYTPAARDAMGGDSAIRAEAALAVEALNTACANSAMATRARLVYCNSIAYTEGVDQEQDLIRLRDTSDGFMDSVHTTRDTVNADMVILYNNQGSGIGYCPGGAPTYSGAPFCTVAWWRAAATFSHAHENGHNLGGGHNVADGGACGPSYGVGLRFTGTDSNGYCTVLAYPTSFYTRVTHWSNPNISYQGTPTGNAIGSANEAYNARVLTDNDNTTEGFEFTRYDMYVDVGSFPIVEIGTYPFPYNTLAEGIAAIDTPNTGAAESPTLYLRNNSPTNLTISKVMTILPCGGAVTIGN